MGKDSRRRQQRKRYEDFLNNEGTFTFDGDDSDGALRATFAHILFIQVFLLFLYYAFLLDDLTFGCKEKETKRNRTPFDQKVGNKRGAHSTGCLKSWNLVLKRHSSRAVVVIGRQTGAGILSTLKPGSALRFVFLLARIPATLCKCTMLA